MHFRLWNLILSVYDYSAYLVFKIRLLVLSVWFYTDIHMHTNLENIPAKIVKKCNHETKYFLHGCHIFVLNYL